MNQLIKGYVQVYTGNGKGKTTSALGLCFRAAGHGMSSHIIQFMKGKIDYGELTAVKRFEDLITISQCGRAEFVNRECPEEVDVRMAGDALGLAREVMREGKVNILVLDEINVALDFRLIEEAAVLELISAKPEKMELILTGRGATPAIIGAADLVTEMMEIKHYWRNGVKGRKGIEL